MKKYRLPRYLSIDPEEKRLAILMGSYLSPASESFDPAFRDLIHKLVPPKENSVEIQKFLVIDFIKKYNRRPKAKYNHVTTDPEESSLALIMYRLFKKDKNFKTFVESHCPKYRNPTANKKLIINFIKKFGRCPRQHGPLPDENRLGRLVHCYTEGKSKDLKFQEEVYNLIKNTDTSRIPPGKKKELILQFIADNLRCPKQNFGNLYETKLFNGYRAYREQSHVSYDPVFKKQVDYLCKELGA
jgi:hypothetical protein